MKRCIPVGSALAVFVAVCAAAHGQDVLDIGKALRPSFKEIALLPTRLTYYNMHEDAAIASYTCCKPWQVEEIRKAHAANTAYLENYYDTDYADDALLHNAYINSVRRNFRYQVEALEELVDRFPHSDVHDDALYKLGSCYMYDKDYIAAIDTFTELANRWPQSVWADDALLHLSRALREVGDFEAMWEAMDRLAFDYPSSDHAALALHSLAARAMEDEDYDEAMRISEHILDDYNCSDYADDAQFRIAEALRHLGEWEAAFDAYIDLLERLPGSSLSNQAMREANSIARQARRVGRDGAPLFDTADFNPGREAQDLWDHARHLQNYREYAGAIERYREFVARFPGHDNYDDALFNIGVCYQQTNMLFEDINKAKGPEDILKLAGEFQDATGAYGSLPTPGQLSAIRDATSAFALVVNNLVGSPLRDDALFEIAKSFEHSEMLEDKIWTYQELMIHFPTSEYNFEALWEVLQYYKDPSHWDAVPEMYAPLARAYPVVFPPALVENKLDFYTVIGHYARASDFAWMEAHHHHIPYVFVVSDLLSHADFMQGALLLSAGSYPDAIRLLGPLAEMYTNDLSTPAEWMVARAYELAGNKKKAEYHYRRIISHRARSGLADDAELALERLAEGCPDIAGYRSMVAERVGHSMDNFDWHVGEHVVVFAPFTVSAKMRQYNMPNIWENAQDIMCDWTGASFDEKTLIYINPGTEQRGGGVIHLPAAQIKDPPQWSLGLAQLAGNAISRGAEGKLGQNDRWAIDGLAQFAAASLQYDLVTETRDAIGSAAAVKLPQEEVLRARDRALQRLAEYVRSNAGPGRLDAGVLCGMLFQLLDNHGYSRHKLIDREPYEDLFDNLRRQPGSGVEALASAINAGFDGQAREQLKQWRLPVREQITRNPAPGG